MWTYTSKIFQFLFPQNWEKFDDSNELGNVGQIILSFVWEYSQIPTA